MSERIAYSLVQLTLYFLKLGTIGFGGPVALVGYMYRDLVETRHWITDEDYKEGLTLAQLMPGPLAAQLAMYLGYVHYRIVGATVAGIAFVLPSFLMVIAIGWAYVRYGGLPWMQAAFYGVGAAVIGIIAISAYKLTIKNIGKDKLLWVIYLVVAGITVWTESETVWLFLGAGVLVWLVRAPPKRGFGNSGCTWPHSAWPTRDIDMRCCDGTRLDVACATRRLLCQGRGLRLWQRPRDRSVLVRRGGARSSVAHRAPVRRRGGRCDDHARPGCHHRRLHWVSDCRSRRSRGGRVRHLSAVLSVHDPACALFQIG